MAGAEYIVGASYNNIKPVVLILDIHEFLKR